MNRNSNSNTRLASHCLPNTAASLKSQWLLRSRNNTRYSPDTVTTVHHLDAVETKSSSVNPDGLSRTLTNKSRIAMIMLIVRINSTLLPTSISNLERKDLIYGIEVKSNVWTKLIVSRRHGYCTGKNAHYFNDNGEQASLPHKPQDFIGFRRGVSRRETREVMRVISGLLTAS